MMFEQPPKPSQFPDGLVVRFGYNGPAAKEQTPHVLGNGDSGCCGLSAQSAVLFSGEPERPPSLKAYVSTVFFLHAFLPLGSVRSEAPNALWSPEAEPLAGSWLASASYQPVKKN